MKQILIIEPHPDDAVLGLFYFLKIIKADYHLISVSADNGRDSKKFCEKMGIVYHVMDSVRDIIYQEHKISPYVIRKQFNSFLYEREYYYKHYMESYSKIKIMITSAVNDIAPEIMMTTLGLLHPLHVLVSMACEETAIEKKRELIYFADFPYVSRKFGKKIIKDSGMCSLQIRDNSLGKDKVKLFEECYPLERSILRWDREVITNSSEKVFFFKERKNEGFGTFCWR